MTSIRPTAKATYIKRALLSSSKPIVQDSITIIDRLTPNLQNALSEVSSSLTAPLLKLEAPKAFGEDFPQIQDRYLKQAYPLIAPSLSVPVLRSYSAYPQSVPSIPSYWETIRPIAASNILPIVIPKVLSNLIPGRNSYDYSNVIDSAFANTIPSIVPIALPAVIGTLPASLPFFKIVPLDFWFF